MVPIASLLGTEYSRWELGVKDHPMTPGSDTTAAAHRYLRGESNAQDKFLILWDVTITGNLT